MALPTIDLEKDSAALKDLKAALQGHQYNEEAIAKLLDLWDISELSGMDYGLYCWKCRRDGTPLGHLVATFLLGLPTTKPKLRKFLGRDVLETLLEIGLITHDGPLYSSEAVIYPCLETMIFTDHWAMADGKQEQGKVYELGSDSYVLARVTPRNGMKNALDLCTGSGVHAVLSASRGLRSQAVDINPRALMYTGFNGLINGVDCPSHLGDLYSPTQDETFDLITANPPFVPSPDTEVLIHRSAGETGEEVPERLVAALPSKLNPNGLFSMVLEHPVFEDDPYLERLERWVGESEGWLILVLTFKEYPAPKYVVRHLGGVDDMEAGYNSYMDSYSAHGIVAMRFANVFIKRLPYQAPNLKINHKTMWPNRCIVGEMENWLDCITTYHDPDWKPALDWRPQMNPQFRDCWINRSRTKAVLELAEGNWLESAPLGPEAAELLFLIDGEKTVADLQQAWSEANNEQGSFEEALAELGLNRALK